MKYFMCFAVIVAVIGVACAHPGAAAAAAASSAAASGATAVTGDPAKKVNPTDTIAALSKNAKDLNPLVVAAQITKFMDTIKEACEKFFQGILGGPGGAGPPDQKDAAAAVASSAASAAASKGKTDAAAASSAAAETGDATKTHDHRLFRQQQVLVRTAPQSGEADPKDAIAASKNAKDLNPTVVAAQITKFMATIEEACEKFLQGIFGGSGASPLGALPAGTPGLDEVAKMSKLFNPLDAGKKIFGNILKDLGGAGASSSEQKDASAAAAGGVSAANAGKKDAEAAAPEAAAPVKAATGGNDMVSAMEQAGSQALSGLFGDFGF